MQLNCNADLPAYCYLYCNTAGRVSPSRIVTLGSTPIDYEYHYFSDTTNYNVSASHGIIVLSSNSFSSAQTFDCMLQLQFADPVLNVRNHPFGLTVPCYSWHPIHSGKDN